MGFENIQSKLIKAEFTGAMIESEFLIIPD
jgi:hypothetical protein